MKHTRIFLALLFLFCLSLFLFLLTACQETRQVITEPVSSPSVMPNAMFDTNNSTTPMPSHASVQSAHVESTETPAASHETNAVPTTPAAENDGSATPNHTQNATRKPTQKPTPEPTIPHVVLQPTAIPERLDPKKPMVALTFDDGPHASVTNRILDVLEQYNAKATFFVVGDRLSSKGCSQAASRAYSLGCEIGSHSYSHAKMKMMSSAEIQTEFQKANTAISKITGTFPTLFRPPYGYVNNTVRAYANAPFIFWSVDPKDWQCRNAAKVYHHIIDNVRDGDIILMHDIYASTAEACEALIPSLLSKGYQLVTVSELFACKEIPLTTGETFRKAR